VYKKIRLAFWAAKARGGGGGGRGTQKEREKKGGSNF